MKMREDWIPNSSEELAEYLRSLRQKREALKKKTKSGRPRRKRLSENEREAVLIKTNRRCHICGGLIDGDAWEADHVLAQSAGGPHSVDNYLPAHRICNNCRWDYLSDEFQEILRLGVWLRTQIQVIL